MKTKTLKSLVCLLLLIVLGGEVLLSAFSVCAAAADGPESFDDTRIEDDLAQLSESSFPANPLGKCDIVAFMEYAYSDYHDYSAVYNLYFYVYNPTEKRIYLGDGSNAVEMAIAYTGDTSDPSLYDKLELEFVDHTDNHRFYKFKLADDSAVMLDLAKQYAASHDGIRKYIITGVEIAHEAGTPIEYDVSKTYDWSGYAAYCDADKTPNYTLECRDYGANSIPLEVRHTNYRFAKKDDYLYDDLSSVYFSIPEEYFQSWGNLTEIHTEWYEYLTSPMFVTSDKGAYTGLWDMRGKRINEFGQLIDENGNVLDSATRSYWRVLWDECKRSVEGDVINYFKWSYNVKCRCDIDDDTYWDNTIFGDVSGHFDLGSVGPNGVLSSQWFSCPSFSYLFYEENVTGADSYRVSSDRVKEYMRKYTSTFYQEELVRGYAASLFDLENSQGYKEHTFNITDSEKYLDKDQDQSWWNEFWFGTKIEGVSYSPIVTISEGDLVLDASDFSAKYLVDEKDASGIMDYARRSYSNGERPMLLRFACRDYYASTARFDYAEEDAFDMSEHDGYVAQEYVYLDFDIISLTFTSDGGIDTVIGAVCTPIDVINGLTPPEELVQEQEWWQILVALLGLIIITSILSMVFPVFRVVLDIIWIGVKGVIKFLLGVLTLPFKVVRALALHK